MLVFPRLLVGAAIINSALAAPWPATVKYATHRVCALANGVEVTVYSPPSKFEVRSGRTFDFQTNYSLCQQTYGEYRPSALQAAGACQHQGYFCLLRILKAWSQRR